VTNLQNKFGRTISEKQSRGERFREHSNTIAGVYKNPERGAAESTRSL
jgi:hypothetical protein